MHLAWLFLAGTAQLLPDWSGTATDFFPLSPALPSQPIFAPHDVSDAACTGVADPFLVRAGDTWFMFFEMMDPVGKIAYATSRDASHWEYQQVVLQPGFHVSWPHVFQVDGVYYMTPETGSAGAVRLYRADPFPETWRHVADLVTGNRFTDPTLFRHHDLWWMFVSTWNSDSCFAYYSSSLDQGWTAHAANPLYASDPGRARAAGRVIQLSGDRLFRLVQDCVPNYGHAVRVFQVDELTPVVFREHEIQASPILEASGTGWNGRSMHQCDPWWVGDHWLAAVDGENDGTWSIGIYRTPALELATEPLRLRCQPNPCSGSTVFFPEAGVWQPGVAGSLTIFDAAGRNLGSRVVPASSSGPGAVTWDGTGPAGRPVAPGVYFCKLVLGERTAATRVVVVR